MLDQITRWRGIFYACLIFAGLGFGAGIMALNSDQADQAGYEAMVSVLGPQGRTPPEPVAPTIFRTSWQLLLVGLLGSVVAMAAEAIVLELRTARGETPAEPAEPAEPDPPHRSESAQVSTPETSPYGPPPSRKPPVLR